MVFHNTDFYLLLMNITSQHFRLFGDPIDDNSAPVRYQGGFEGDHVPGEFKTSVLRYRTYESVLNP